MRFALAVIASLASLMVIAQDAPPMPTLADPATNNQPPSTNHQPPSTIIYQEPHADVASSPAIARALERRAMKPKVRVKDQFLFDGKVISRMSDGSQVTGQVIRATTARLTPSGRDLRDAEIATMAKRLGVDPADPRAVAVALKGHREKLDTLETEATKNAGKSGALGALAGLALGAAAAAKVAKKKTT